MPRPVVILGDSPATYVCAIYLFTANIKPVVVRMKQPLVYGCAYAPGVVDEERGEKRDQESRGERDEEKDHRETPTPSTTTPSATAYTEKCYLQAKNMGIEIINVEECTIERRGGVYVVNGEIEGVYLVVDRAVEIKGESKERAVQDAGKETTASPKATTAATTASLKDTPAAHAADKNAAGMDAHAADKDAPAAHAADKNAAGMDAHAADKDALAAHTTPLRKTLPTHKNNLFIVEDHLLEREAIVVAGVGCMIAFALKELL